MISSVLILDGNQKYGSLDQRIISSARLVVARHPAKSNIFVMMKARNLPCDFKPSRALGNITRKTLDKLITANL